MPPPTSEVAFHMAACPDSYSKKFVHESKWMFVANLKTFFQGIPVISPSQELDEWADNLKTLSLATDSVHLNKLTKKLIETWKN